MPEPGPPTHLLYLHGFRSSPQSFKAQRLQAQRLQAWLRKHRPAVHGWCPQLPPSPAEAMALVNDGIRDWPADTSAVLGSSLGGFYATAVAEATGWPAVLINPAVDPARDLAAYVGELSAFHDPHQTFLFRAEYIDELRALAMPRHHPARTLLGRHRQGRRSAELARDERTLRRLGHAPGGRQRPRAVGL